MIRTIIQIVGVSIFLVSIFFKLRAIILMGGTKMISDELEQNDQGDAEEGDAPTPPALETTETESAMPMPTGCGKACR